MDTDNLANKGSIQDFVHIKNETDLKTALEQYKLLVDSLNNTNNTRETSNTFWTTVNSLLISSIAYLKGLQAFSSSQYYFFLWTLVALGSCLCIVWIRSLLTIKKTVDIRDCLLIELEKYFPAKIFTASIQLTQRLQNKTSLTLKEMYVPYLFLFGYFILGFILAGLHQTILAYY